MTVAPYRRSRNYIATVCLVRCESVTTGDTSVDMNGLLDHRGVWREGGGPERMLWAALNIIPLPTASRCVRVSTLGGAERISTVADGTLLLSVGRRAHAFVGEGESDECFDVTARPLRECIRVRGARSTRHRANHAGP